MSLSAPIVKTVGVRALIRANCSTLFRERMRAAFSRGHKERRAEYKKRGAEGKKASYYAGIHGLLSEAVKIMSEYNTSGRGACTRLVFEIFVDIMPKTGTKSAKPMSYDRFLHKTKEIRAGRDIYDVVIDHRGGNNKRRESPVIRKWLLDLMKSGKAYGCPYMHKLIAEKCAEMDFWVPSLSWVRFNYYSLYPCVEQFRYGRDAHYYGSMPYAGLIQAGNPGAQWQIDGWQLPFYMEGFKKMTLFAVKDACSRMILGYTIAPTENTDTIMEALENAAVTSGTIPREIVSDNHSFNKTKEAANLKEALLMFGCVWTVDQNPRRKSIIERDFGTFGNVFCKPMYGYIGEGVTSRRKNGRTSQDLRDKYQRSGRWLTADQIKEIGIKCVNEWNNTARNGNESPSAAYEAGDNVGVAVEDYVAVSLFVRATDAKVTRGQINITRGGILHEYQMNSADIARYNGKKVTVRFSDYSQIYVFDKDTDNFICRLEPKKYAHAAIYEQSEADKLVLMGQKSRLNGVLSAFAKQREEIAAAAAAVSPDAAYDMNAKLMPKDLREEFLSNGELMRQAERLGVDVYTVRAIPTVSEVPGDDAPGVNGARKGRKKAGESRVAFATKEHKISIYSKSNQTD